MAYVRDFFASRQIPSAAFAIDVGTGTNLYPGLAMLPFCTRLDLCDWSLANVRWLRRQVHRFDDNWDDFWKVYAEREPYAQVEEPRQDFARRVRVLRRSVFDLPKRRWDLGTMFFVACSLSSDPGEFQAAIAGFLGALRVRAPFAAAFMAHSEGYRIGDREFPAVDVDAEMVARSLDSIAYDVSVHPIEIGTPLRTGYGGMIVAVGHVAPPAGE